MWILEEALAFFPWPASFASQRAPTLEQKLELRPLLHGALLTSTCSQAGSCEAQHDRLFLQGRGHQRSLQWAMKPPRPFFPVLPPWCPFFNQMFLILQEVRQGLI